MKGRVLYIQKDIISRKIDLSSLKKESEKSSNKTLKQREGLEHKERKKSKQTFIG